MSNGERGRKLLAASREHLAEMEGALRRSSWNIAVRRAQEVVELALKAVLTYLCIDYPKVHDAADLFVATLAARQMALSEVEAADVQAISARLAERRAPAFYFEYDDEPAGARGAAADARRIQRLCARIAADIERAAAARQEQAGGDRKPPAGAAD